MGHNEIEKIMNSNGHHPLEKVAGYRIERTFINHGPDRWLIFKIYKKLKKPKTANQENNPTKKWGTDLDR